MKKINFAGQNNKLIIKITACVVVIAFLIWLGLSIISNKGDEVNPATTLAEDIVNAQHQNEGDKPTSDVNKIESTVETLTVEPALAEVESPLNNGIVQIDVDKIEVPSSQDGPISTDRLDNNEMSKIGVVKLADDEEAMRHFASVQIMGATVRFKFAEGKTYLADAARVTLTPVATAGVRGQSIVITTHLSPELNGKANEALALKRALSIKSVLMALGAPEKSIIMLKPVAADEEVMYSHNLVDVTPQAEAKFTANKVFTANDEAASSGKK